MSITLSYGYKKPQTGDKGSTWFPDLEADIQQLNDHAHNGSNSARIPSTNILSVKVSLDDPVLGQPTWTTESPGKFYKEITIPNNADYADVFVMVKNDVGEQMFLDIKPVSGNTKKFKVYSNDSGLSATAHILV